MTRTPATSKPRAKKQPPPKVTRLHWSVDVIVMLCIYTGLAMIPCGVNQIVAFSHYLKGFGLIIGGASFAYLTALVRYLRAIYEATH